MGHVLPNDFQEWMDSSDVTEEQRQRLDVLVATTSVRMFLIGLFDHGATWDQIAKAGLMTSPNRQSPVEQVASMCPIIMEKDIPELGETLLNMKDGGWAPFVKDVLGKLTMQQRVKLSNYVTIS